MIVGIDPGLEGALAIVDDDGALIDAQDLPHIEKVLDALDLTNILRDLHMTSQDIVVVERVQAMPQNGSIGNFKLGYSFGVISGVVKSLGIPMDTSTPAMWKKRMGLSGKTKDASRLLVRDLFPDKRDLFARMKDNGRSDAVCIALDYHRRNRVG